MMKTDPRPKRCLLLTTDNWEAFYYGDTLITQDHAIDRMELLMLSEVYDFTKDELVVEEASERDAEECYECGNFPDRLSDLQDQYY